MNEYNTSAHLRTVLALRNTEPEPDDGQGLPNLTLEPYQAAARPAAKPVFALHCILATGAVQSFQYQHLDSSTKFLHDKLELRFFGARLTHVTIKGRNLWKLYDYIHQHRLAWVRVADRDFAANGETIITAIQIEEPLIPKL